MAELREELERLKTVRRQEVAKRLKRAKELGDLSENSEYQEAREEQRQVETRIVELESLLKTAQVIKRTGGGKVTIGSTIRVVKDGVERTFTIVGPNEADPGNGRISHESPIGSAFLEKKVSDRVKVKSPGGESVYEITAIE